MAGEYELARICIEQALDSAAATPTMDVDVAAGALLSTLLTHMLKTRSREDLASLVAFQLESCGEDEFVVTRGC